MRVRHLVAAPLVVFAVAGCADSSRYDLGQQVVPTSVPLTTTTVTVDDSLLSGVVELVVEVPDNHVEHVVRSGDLLSRLAVQYGTTVDAILEINRDVDPNAMAIGDVLVIPTSDR